MFFFFFFFIEIWFTYWFNESAKSVSFINQSECIGMQLITIIDVWFSILLVSFSLEARRLKLIWDWKNREKQWKYFIRSHLNYVVVFKNIGSIPFQFDFLRFRFKRKPNKLFLFSFSIKSIVESKHMKYINPFGRKCHN